MKETLGGESWTVETCSFGAAAIEKLSGSSHYDLLIFDNQLPDTSGVGLIRQTRGMAHRQQTLIIMLSGDDVEREARRAGANAFLKKPADVPALAETVARLLARKSKRH